MWHTRINFRFLFADFYGFSNGAYRVAVSFKGFGAFNVRNVAASVAQWGTGTKIYHINAFL